MITLTTGTYDETKVYTAWELAADWWWQSAGLLAVPFGGRARYETLTIGPREGICARRLEGRHQIDRYVAANSRFRLEPTQER